MTQQIISDNHDIQTNFEETVEYWDTQLPNYRFAFIPVGSNWFCNIYSCKDMHPLQNGLVTSLDIITDDDTLTRQYRGNPRSSADLAFAASVNQMRTIESMFYVTDSKGNQTPYNEAALIADDNSVLLDFSVAAKTSFVMARTEYDVLVKRITDFTEIDWLGIGEQLETVDELMREDPSKDDMRLLKKMKKEIIDDRTEHSRRECEAFGFWQDIRHCRLIQRPLDQNWVLPNLYSAMHLNEPVLFSEYRAEVEYKLEQQNTPQAFVNTHIVNLFQSIVAFPRRYVKDGDKHILAETKRGGQLMKFGNDKIYLNDEDLVIIDFNLRQTV